MKVLFAFVALSMLACSAFAASYSTIAMGRVLCRVAYTDYPIKEVTVKLKDKGTIVDDLFASTRSDSNGYFYVSGSVRELFGNPEPYIKVEYQYVGLYGNMEVNGLLNTVRDDRSRTKPYRSFLDFGDIIFSGDHCRAYVKFYDALADFYNRTGESFPIQPLHIRTKAILNFGEPYAEIKTISIPERYPVFTRTAMVQLGHILRHSLDGDMAHLLKDAARFSYNGPHQCNTATNKGRAFDEGWGEFWATGCTDFYYGYYQRDYNIIGNVAGGLRRLQVRCGFTDGDMIDVLRRNPGGIHSFEEYEQASNCDTYNYNTYRSTTPPVPYTRRTTTYVPPPFGITGYKKEVQEESKEERIRMNKAMIQTFLKLLESKK